MRTHDDAQDAGFTLIELLVVVIIIGILAAIAIPRFLSQRDQANNAAAVSDLRNLIVIEAALEATGGLTESRSEILAEGWEASSNQIVVCANLNEDEDDITLASWHIQGSLQFSYTRSGGVLESYDVPLSTSCLDQPGQADAEQISPAP